MRLQIQQTLLFQVQNSDSPKWTITPTPCCVLRTIFHFSNVGDVVVDFMIMNNYESFFWLMTILNNLTRKVSPRDLSCKQPPCKPYNKTFKIKFSQFPSKCIEQIENTLCSNSDFVKFTKICSATTTTNHPWKLSNILICSGWESSRDSQSCFCESWRCLPSFHSTKYPPGRLFARWLKCWRFPGHWKPFVFGGNLGQADEYTGTFEFHSLGGRHVA